MEQIFFGRQQQQQQQVQQQHRKRAQSKINFIAPNKTKGSTKQNKFQLL